jgi:murein DD-endopeptidase MepM/ murein hydrolase activator NlpD
MPANVLAAATALVLLPASAVAVVSSVTPDHTARPPSAGSSPPTRPETEPRRAVTEIAPERRGSVGGWRWPLAPRPAVVRGFAVGPYRWSPGHRGVDLAAARGDAVLAPADGIATFVRTIVDRPVLVITHAGGIRTAYEPVTASVPPGTRVARGAVIGRVTAAPGHCMPRTCVHWSARRGSGYIDPLSLLTPPRIVLLPHTSELRARDG